MEIQQSVNSEPRKRGRPVKSADDASAKIRKAALSAFARAGFSGVSVMEIAQIAGVAKPLVHYHYASKDALWVAAVEEAIADLHREMLLTQQAIASFESPVALLRRFSAQLVFFAARHPELVRIVLAETGQGGPRSQWLDEHFLLPSYALSRLIIEKLSAELKLGADAPRPEHVVPAVLGLMHFPFLEADTLQKAYGTDVYSEAYLQRHGEMLFNVFIAMFRMV